VKQQRPPAVVTVKVTEPIDVTPAATSDTVTKPSEDVSSTEPIDDDSSNDLVVVVVIVVCVQYNTILPLSSGVYDYRAGQGCY